MKTKEFKEEELQAIYGDEMKPFVVATSVSDLLVLNCFEIKNDMIEEGFWTKEEEPNLFEVLEWYLKGKSGNDFEVLTVRESEICKVRIV